MAFCGKCGAQSEVDERFCPKCGNDMKANAAPAAAASIPAAPRPMAPAPPPAMPAAPPSYSAPQQIPIMMGPPPVQARHSGVMWTVIIVAAVLGGLYYIGTHKSLIPGAAPAAPGNAPANPGAAPANPGAAPADPGSGSNHGANAALAKTQAFDAHWTNVNGFIQLTNGTWKNNGTATVQSATLECDQFDTSGNVLDEMRTTLNGPVAPGATDGFSPFWMGAVAANLNKVTCSIVHVKQPGQ
jgi:hypothetical protein